MKSFLKEELSKPVCDEAGRVNLGSSICSCGHITQRDLKPASMIQKIKSKKERIDSGSSSKKKKAMHWQLHLCSPVEIDHLNILWASVKPCTMHSIYYPSYRKHIIIDGGNRFKPYQSIKQLYYRGGW